MEKICRTCSWGNMHSQDMKLGDCMQPDGHRWWRQPVSGVTKEGKEWRSVALLDAFGREETRPGFHCGNWTAPSQPLQDH